MGKFSVKDFRVAWFLNSFSWVSILYTNQNLASFEEILIELHLFDHKTISIGNPSINPHLIYSLVWSIAREVELLVNKPLLNVM